MSHTTALSHSRLAHILSTMVCTRHLTKNLQSNFGTASTFSNMRIVCLADFWARGHEKTPNRIRCPLFHANLLLRYYRRLRWTFLARSYRASLVIYSCRPVSNELQHGHSDCGTHCILDYLEHQPDLAQQIYNHKHCVPIPTHHRKCAPVYHICLHAAGRTMFSDLSSPL